MTEISRETIKAYALENAIKYDGKANQGAVLAGLFSEGLDKSKIKEIVPRIQEVIEEINSLPVEEQKEEFKKLEKETSKREIRTGLKELPNATKGKVIMRLAPFPSGPLHIGNARTAILNDEYCKMYEGKFILVMDDTIGSDEKRIQPEAYELIQEGLDWLKINYDKKIIYKSDRTKKYYEYAEEMLKKGYLYVCDCPQEKMHELKEKGIECPCRHIEPEKQLKKWKELFKSKPGEMCVRLKTSMQDPDPAFRDRVMFKISDRSHPRTKNKFRVYPTMEFSWAIDDHVLGTTHVLRGVDHYMSTRVQDFIRKIFEWENPISIYNGHLKIEGTKISKSKGSKEVESGNFSGWNDPRTWSLQSLRDRGIDPQAIREFIAKLGTRKTNITAPADDLYAINKKFLKDIPKYTFVENPKKIKIHGCPDLTEKIPSYKNKELQTFLISEKEKENMQDKNYRLVNLLNFKSEKIKSITPREFSFISEDPDTKLNASLVQWLPSTQENTKIEIVMPNGKIKKGKSEPELKKTKQGEIIHFRQLGFAKLHKKSKDKLEFFFAHN